MIPTLKDWKAGTSVTGRWRSAEMVVVDIKIASYYLLKTTAAHDAVGVAWAAWKAAHVSDVKTLLGNKRNKAGVLEIMDAEFAVAVGDAVPVAGKISRIALRFPAERPAGFANIDDQMARDRIDKAFVDGALHLGAKYFFGHLFFQRHANAAQPAEGVPHRRRYSGRQVLHKGSEGMHAAS